MLKRAFVLGAGLVLVLGGIAHGNAIYNPIDVDDEDWFCVGQALPEPPASTTTESDPVVDDTLGLVPAPMACFTTARQALINATGVDPGFDPGQITAPLVRTLDALLPTQTIIGVSWGKENSKGSSVLWKADYGCFQGVTTWVVSNVGPQWNDRISSSEAFARCDIFRHFEHASFKGATLNCSPQCSTMGAMNNQTTSLKWKARG